MIFKQVVAISSSRISNSSVRGDGTHLNLLRRCRPIIRRIEAGTICRNRGLYHV